VGSVWNNSGFLYVGFSGTGSLTVQNGGTVSNAIGVLGYLVGSSSSGSATVDGVGSRWNNSRNLDVGVEGTGSLVVQNGGTVSNTTGALGWFSGSSGSATVDGAGSSWNNSGSLYVGGGTVAAGGTGSLTAQNGGAVNVAGTLRIWNTGTVNLNGGIISAGDLVNDGAFNFNAGTLNVANSLLFDTAGPLGNSLVLTGAKTLNVGGTTTLGDSTLTLDGGTLTVGEKIVTSGFGELNINGGTLTVGEGNGSIDVNVFRLGFDVGTTGSHTITGNGSLSAEHLSIGDSGTGSFAQSGGTVSVTIRLRPPFGLILGRLETGKGTYDMSGGSLSTQDAYVGELGTGSFIQSGGTVSVAGRAQGTAATGLIIGWRTSGTGVYELSGGSLSAIDEYVGEWGSGTFTQTGGTNTVSNTLTIAANPGSSGSYDLQGGTLTVNNGIVNNGSFHVVAGATATVGGAGLANNASGELTGSGTIQGNVVSAGLVSPGDSVGVLSINGDYSQSGILAIEIGGLLAGSEYDVLNVSGTATLDGTLSISLLDGFNPFAGSYYDLFAADSISGSFSQLLFPELSGGLSWNLALLTDFSGGTDYLRLSAVSAVPVPPALWLFGSGLLGLAGIARRKAEL
jgi:T5SS/PEP-CTERM-associated repeat protein